MPNSLKASNSCSAWSEMVRLRSASSTGSLSSRRSNWGNFHLPSYCTCGGKGHFHSVCSAVRGFFPAAADLARRATHPHLHPLPLPNPLLPLPNPFFFVCVRQFVLVFILFLIFFPLFFFGVLCSSTATVPRAWLSSTSTGSSPARRRRLGLHQIDHHRDGPLRVHLWQGNQAQMENMRSAAHHKPMARPVPQMIGVPSQPKQAQFSDNPRAHSAPFPSGNTPNPLANAAHSAARAKVRPRRRPRQRWSVRAPEWTGSHDGADHRQPHASTECAKQPSGKQRLPGCPWHLDVFPFIGRATNSECVGHVVGRVPTHRRLPQTGARGRPVASGGLELVESIDSEQRLALLDEDFFFEA